MILRITGITSTQRVCNVLSAQKEKKREEERERRKLVWFCSTSMSDKSFFVTLRASFVSRSQSLILLPAERRVLPFGPSRIHLTPCLSAFHLLLRRRLSNMKIYENL